MGLGMCCPSRRRVSSGIESISTIGILLMLYSMLTWRLPVINVNRSRAADRKPRQSCLDISHREQHRMTELSCDASYGSRTPIMSSP